MGFFQDVFGNAGAQDAANAKIAGLNAGYGQASDQYGQGRNAINTNYAAALSPFTALSGSATQGANAYGDATGANGAAGNARGLANFQASPGYQWQLGQGLQAIDRGAASRGMLTSGNTLTAEQQYGQGLANQNYQQYVQNLQPYLGQQTSAAAGVAGVNMGQGNALNTSYGNQGNLAYNTQVGIGNAQGSADLSRAAGNQSLFGNAMSLGSTLLGFGGGLSGMMPTNGGAGDPLLGY